MTLFLISSCVDVVSAQYSENKVTFSDSSPSVEIMLFQISSQVLDLTVAVLFYTHCVNIIISECCEVLLS